MSEIRACDLQGRCTLYFVASGPSDRLPTLQSRRSLYIPYLEHSLSPIFMDVPSSNLDNLFLFLGSGIATL